ncbi:hypothetical protein PR048_007176 [Dryococelus australis]|uniref:Uncharacterized protein n=1 Tax=Dryococelus australis TaxID=614101 RepID=A0ABQ9IE51_9NEOP|nr:hypothetical protein PR048_007176 [Dryococelus australis]
MGPRWCSVQTTRIRIEANRVRFPARSLPDFRSCESCRTMPGRRVFSGVSGSPPPSVTFRRRMTSMLRATQISSFHPIPSSQLREPIFLDLQNDPELQWRDVHAMVKIESDPHMFPLKTGRKTGDHFFVFIGHLKARVYAVPVDDVGTLRDRIEAVCETIRIFPEIPQHIRVSMQQRDVNTARLARRSDEALGVRVSVALIAPSLLDLGRSGPMGVHPTLELRLLGRPGSPDRELSAVPGSQSDIRRVSQRLALPIRESVGATVAERLACSPPTKAIRVQSLAGSLQIFACGNRTGRCRWSTGVSRGSLISSTPLFRRCSTLTSITLIETQDLDDRSCPNLFTRSSLTFVIRKAIIRSHLNTATNNQTIMSRVYRELSSLACCQRNPRDTRGSTHKSGIDARNFCEIVCGALYTTGTLKGGIDQPFSQETYFETNQGAESSSTPTAPRSAAVGLFNPGNLNTPNRRGKKASHSDITNTVETSAHSPKTVPRGAA